MRSALSATLFLLCALSSWHPLEAQQIRSPYRFIDETQSVGVYGGWLFTNPGRLGLGPQNAPILGVRYNARFTGPLSGEVAVSFAPSEREIVGADTVAGVIEAAPTGQLVPMNLLMAEGGLRFHLTGPRAWRGVAPYVLASGGLAVDLSGRTEDDLALPEPQQFRFGPSFAVGLGAGTDLFLTERLSLRLEARNHILRTQIPGGFQGTGRADTEWTNNFALTAGTSLHF
jgi:hypothetical protein